MARETNENSEATVIENIKTLNGDVHNKSLIVEQKAEPGTFYFKNFMKIYFNNVLYKGEWAQLLSRKF